MGSRKLLSHFQARLDKPFSNCYIKSNLERKSNVKAKTKALVWLGFASVGNFALAIVTGNPETISTGTYIGLLFLIVYYW